MKKRVLKKGVIYGIYISLGILLTGSLFYIGTYTKYKDPESKYVDENIDDDVTPVVKKDPVLIRPYTDTSVTVLSNYYDYNGDESNQEGSIIYYDNTYLQNTGVIYGSSNAFDVVAIYDGEVIKVDDSDTLGKVVEVRHSNDIISVYQLLSEVDVSVNTTVKQGDKIGKSGTSNIVDNTKQQLYFELIVRGELLNGENYFGKKLGEI